MFEIKELTRALKQVADEKGLEPAKVLEAIEASLAAAYKKEYRERGEMIKATLDLQTGEMNFWQVKIVVTPEDVRVVEEGTEEVAEAQSGEEEQKLPRYNEERHIFLKEAKKIKKDVVAGEELSFPLEQKEDFGRIAAQIAKQTIIQKLRESERESILGEWRGKEGQIASGIIQRFERGNVYIDLGRAIGVMFANESIPGEHYRPNERLRFFVMAVQEDTRLPGIILSRSHPKFVMKLFEMEVPEIADKTVEIKTITREPGSRTKIAVSSNSEGVDPIGACVGQRGTRVMAVNNELGQEKIDIIEWADDPKKFIANALSPAKVEAVETLDHHEARVYVPEDQLSLAIGRGGQNVRMAAKLTGWRIDVRSQTRPDQVQEGGIAEAPADEVVPVDGDEQKASYD
ncbi:MAG: transcription termination factor NusA [Sedimentisphaerales bacterium]|nr:transcription termination factor NusA [Sedimentisphaerales bacterium]